MALGEGLAAHADIPSVQRRTPHYPLAARLPHLPGICRGGLGRAFVALEGGSTCHAVLRGGVCCAGLGSTCVRDLVARAA